MSASIAAGLAISAAYVGLADADLAVPGGAELRSQLDRYGWTVFRRVASHKDVLKKTLEARDRIRREITDAVVNVKLKPDIPDSKAGVWDVAQVVSAVYRDPGATNDDLRLLPPLLDQIFQGDLVVVTNGRRVGWRESFVLSRAEAAIWTIIALTGALARDSGESKAAHAKHLQYLLTVA